MRSKLNILLQNKQTKKKRHKLATLFNSFCVSYNAPSVLLTETRKCCKKAIFKKMTLLQSTVQINIMCALHLHRIHTYATFSFKSSNNFQQWKTIQVLRKPVRNNPK